MNFSNQVVEGSNGHKKTHWKDNDLGHIILCSPTNNCQVSSISHAHKLLTYTKDLFDKYMIELRNKSGTPLVLIEIHARHLKRFREYKTPQRIVFIQEFTTDKGTKRAICLFYAN